MQSRVHREDRRSGAATVIRRLAVLVSSGSLALLALALSTGPDGTPRIATPASAADQNSNSDGATSGAPGQPAVPPTTGQGPSTQRVIKEIGGVPREAELSSEEELEAIRNGWGTWRTADGPESVIAQ